MDRAKLLLRVHQLIALAGSDFEGEARTAAALACKLIRENGLFVLAEIPAPQIPPPPPVYEPPTEPRVRRVIIRAKFDSLCQECGDEIWAGSRCAYAKGHGAVHVGCYV